MRAPRILRKKFKFSEGNKHTYQTRRVQLPS